MWLLSTDFAQHGAKRGQIPPPTNLIHTFLRNGWKQVDQKTFNLWVYDDETC